MAVFDHQIVEIRGPWPVGIERHPHDAAAAAFDDHAAIGVPLVAQHAIDVVDAEVLEMHMPGGAKIVDH